MTWREWQMENYGYEVITTYWEDFSIADRFGCNAVKNTYKRAFEYADTDHKVLTELVMVLNHKCWMHYEKGNEKLSRVYSDLYYEARDHAYTTLKGDALNYFVRVLN